MSENVALFINTKTRCSQQSYVEKLNQVKIFTEIPAINR